MMLKRFAVDCWVGIQTPTMTLLITNSRLFARLATSVSAYLNVMASLVNVVRLSSVLTFVSNPPVWLLVASRNNDGEVAEDTICFETDFLFSRRSRSVGSVLYTSAPIVDSKHA